MKYGELTLMKNTLSDDIVICSEYTMKLYNEGKSFVTEIEPEIQALINSEIEVINPLVKYCKSWDVLKFKPLNYGSGFINPKQRGKKNLFPVYFIKQTLGILFRIANR